MNIKLTLERLNELMTDAQIGEAIGAPQSTVQRLRVGKHKSTFYERAEAIKRLARAKNVLLDDDQAA